MYFVPFDITILWNRVIGINILEFGTGNRNGSLLKFNHEFTYNTGYLCLFYWFEWYWDSGENTIDDYDDPGYCYDCGGRMEIVRPGKYQCPTCECDTEWNGDDFD